MSEPLPPEARRGGEGVALECWAASSGADRSSVSGKS